MVEDNVIIQSIKQLKITCTQEHNERILARAKQVADNNFKDKTKVLSRK